VQLWCAPLQAAGVPYAKQPLAPRVHVATLPLTHAVCPWLQLSEQLIEHAAPGAIPEQVCGFGQGEVDAT
jgi:hypothetical protein